MDTAGGESQLLTEDLFSGYCFCNLYFPLSITKEKSFLASVKHEGCVSLHPLAIPTLKANEHERNNGLEIDSERAQGWEIP